MLMMMLMMLMIMLMMLLMMLMMLMIMLMMYLLMMLWMIMMTTTLVLGEGLRMLEAVARNPIRIAFAEDVAKKVHELYDASPIFKYARIILYIIISTFCRRDDDKITTVA